MSYDSCPYNNFPKKSFWHKSIKLKETTRLRLEVNPKFKINKNSKIATAGSCFAQNLTYFLSNNGLNILSLENVPNVIETNLAKQYGYKTFSARYGNIYTSRQLIQLLKRSLGIFKPKDDIWKDSDGNFYDAFRPSLNPKGWSNINEFYADRKKHLETFKNLIISSDIFVFTLGLTEGWQLKKDGSFYPICPGCGYGTFSSSKHEFVNLRVNEIVEDLQGFIDIATEINPSLKFILSVSPVPLIATATNEHIFIANNFSKSTLRVAADEITRLNKNVEYFPSYEMIISNKIEFFEDDLRSVSLKGINHVMNEFMENFTVLKYKKEILDDKKNSNIEHLYTDVICDEENLIEGLNQR